MVVLYLFTGISSICTAQLLPPIITGPNSSTVSKGSTVSFSVSVLNLLGAPTYQWYFNNSPIAGATSTTLTLNNVSVQNIGSYYIACNAGIWGIVDSGTATLSVYDSPPTVTNDAYTAVENVTLTVAAPGVLTNDKAAYAGPLTALLATNVSHGTLNLNANGGFTYVPAAYYYGNDSFYYYASDGMSNSTPARVSLSITLNAPKVTSLTAANVTANSATFKAKVNPEGAAATYYFQYGLTTNYGSFTATNSLTAKTNSVSVYTSIYGLAPATEYHYRVVAMNAGGVSVSADTNFTTAYPPPTATTLGASSVTAGSATLNAAVNPQGTGVSYCFLYGLTTNYDSWTYTNYLAADKTTSAVSMPIDSLASGTTYYYSVMAMSSGGTTIATNASFTTLSIPPYQFAGTLVNDPTNGQYMELDLNSVTGATFTVLSTSDLTQPLSNWTVVGWMTEISTGQYQFDDPVIATNPCCFYSIQSN